MKKEYILVLLIVLAVVMYANKEEPVCLDEPIEQCVLKF